MSERSTGATDAQIERAAERLFNFRMTGDANTSHQTGNEPTWKIVSRRRYVTPIHEVVDFLVTTEERIVLVDDLRIVLSDLRYTTDASERLREAIGDAP
jgi:hypothetical protein